MHCSLTPSSYIWMFVHKQVDTNIYTLTHTHTHTCMHMHKHMLPRNLDKGAKCCKLGPLSQQVDEDNWIRCVWSLGPRDQSSGTSGQTNTHTYTHTQEKMRTPCRASEAEVWLIKEAWHPYPGPTSRCRASGPGSQPRAPSRKESDLGTQTSLCPCAPSTITKYHLEARSRTVWPLWQTHEALTPPSLADYCNYKVNIIITITREQVHTSMTKR